MSTHMILIVKMKIIEKSCYNLWTFVYKRRKKKVHKLKKIIGSIRKLKHNYQLGSNQYLENVRDEGKALLLCKGELTIFK